MVGFFYNPKVLRKIFRAQLRKHLTRCHGTAGVSLWVCEGELHQGAPLQSEQMYVRNLWQKTVLHLFWCSYSSQIHQDHKVTLHLPVQCTHLLGGHCVVSCHPHRRVPLDPPVLADLAYTDFCQLSYIIPVRELK